MIELPNSSPFDEDKIYRVIGIDPGVNSLGLSVFEKNVKNGKIALVWSETIKSKRFEKDYSDIAKRDGERFAKVWGYKNTLVDYFNNFQPNSVISEGNYMGKFPNAYSALTEMVLIIRLALMDYNSSISLKVIDPSTVKKFLGVKGNASDKNLINEKIKSLDIIFHLPQKIDKLDEHSIDSIAIGYWGVKN